MTRTEEKLYDPTVFDAIDQNYPMKHQKPVNNYEERLRASFNKLLVPDWFNQQYTSNHGLRKTKSHGHVPRAKRINGEINHNHNSNHNNNNNNNNNTDHHQHHDETPDISVTCSLNSPLLSNGNHRASLRHRSPSRSWSERPTARRDSTTSSCDSNTNVINGRRSLLSNGNSSYAPGVQRVAQSSTWYKPRAFTVQLSTPIIEPPKPLPRYSKMEQEKPQLSNGVPTISSVSIDRSIRHPIKSRSMAQSNESKIDALLENEQIKTNNDQDNMDRAPSIRSISSEAESFRSAIQSIHEKNLLASDSSSYASVNERCLSPSTASYHTALTGDTISSASSTTYETPTPQYDDEQTTLSSHSSLSDLSHAETLEPNADDLDPTAIIMSTTIVEESNSLSKDGVNDMDHSTTNESCPIENTNWYDGSLETCLEKTGEVKSIQEREDTEVREISNDEDLREIDLNAVGDEFFLFSPHMNNEDESPRSITEEKSEQESDSSTNLAQLAIRIFSMDNNQNGNTAFHVSSSNDPFSFESIHPSSIMITNLDDILMNDNDDDDDDDDDDDNQDDQEIITNNNQNQYFNRHYRRPIQEDILYEVEHENSYSDHSQNTSSIVPTDEQVSIKVESSGDYLTSTENSLGNNIPSVPVTEKSVASDQQPSVGIEPNVLPIYMLPPLHTTSICVDGRPSTISGNSPSSLCIETDNHLEKWEALMSDLVSPSLYTSKIRHRHYSVGSYYDHKTGNVSLHSNPTSYFLGSAPVSPLSRSSLTSNDSHYHHSPILLTPLRRINPFTETNYDQTHPFDLNVSSFHKDELTQLVATTRNSLSPSVETGNVLPVPSMRTSSVPFQSSEISSAPFVAPRSAVVSNQNELSDRSLPTASLAETTLIRPETSRGSRPVPNVPPRTALPEQDLSQHIYQKVNPNLKTRAKQEVTTNPDIEFIRAAIERVFDFRVSSSNDTNSDASTYYEELTDNEVQQSNESIKKSNQYPAVEAIERFYQEKRIPVELVTNLDDNPASQTAQMTVRMKNTSKSSDIERASSEEVDDTLNDIEEVEENEEQKFKNKKSSQQTQTIEQGKSMIVNRRSRSSSTSPVEITKPSVAIGTEMIVQSDEPDNGEGEMVIFYDEIEIVEHPSSSSSYSSESESESNSVSAPPIPARTLKPTHLVDKNPSRQTPTVINNKIYEFDHSNGKKRFDVNTVNQILNRTERNLSSAVGHRHPSARHFVGKLNNDDISTPLPPPPPPPPPKANIVKNQFATLPSQSSSRSIIADTTALVKQLQNALSRNSLHDKNVNSQMSTSSKDLRTFVSTTYSPSDEDLHDEQKLVYRRGASMSKDEQQPFKRQARLSKSFHNVSECNQAELDTNLENKLSNQAQPSKSFENDLDQIRPRNSRPNIRIPLKLSAVAALPSSDENHRLLSTKWYTGNISESAQISYEKSHLQQGDLLKGYITTHGNPETQALLARLMESNDSSIQTALDEIRLRVLEFDASKTQDDLQVFMGYLERRLRGIITTRKITRSVDGSSTPTDTLSVQSQNGSNRQLGRQQLRNVQPPTVPRRSSQSSSNQENPMIIDEIPKKTPRAINRERVPPLLPAQMITNNVNSHKSDREIGKRLFESGTYKDPRLIYDGPMKQEKEEPLETSV